MAFLQTTSTSILQNKAKQATGFPVAPIIPKTEVKPKIFSTERKVIRPVKYKDPNLGQDDPVDTSLNKTMNETKAAILPQQIDENSRVIVEDINESKNIRLSMPDKNKP